MTNRERSPSDPRPQWFGHPPVGPDDPSWLYQEIPRLRGLVRVVAAELERLVAEEVDPRRRAVLLRRAMRIPAKLHEAWPVRR